MNKIKLTPKQIKQIDILANSRKEEIKLFIENLQENIVDWIADDMGEVDIGDKDMSEELWNAIHKAMYDKYMVKILKELTK